MRKRWRQIREILRWDFGYLLCFELAHKLLGFLLLLPFFRSTLSNLLGNSVVDILTGTALRRIFLSPAALALCLVWLLVFWLYFYWEIAVLALYGQRGWRRETDSFFKLVLLGAWRALGLFRPKNLALAGLLTLALPLLTIPFAGNLGMAGKLPDYVQEYLLQNKTLWGLGLLLLALLSVLLLHFLFGFHAMVVEGKPFAQAWKQSIELLRGRRRQAATQLLAGYGALVVVLLLFYLLAVAGTALYANLRFSDNYSRSVFQLTYLGWSRVLRLVAAFLATLWYFVCGTQLLYAFRGEGRRKPPAPRKHRLLRAISALGVLAFLLVISETELGGLIFHGPGQKIDVVAHRGGALLAPENTLEALEAAISSGSDQAEIDVRQVADGTLLLFHDSKMKRILGVDAPIWEWTYSQIQQLPGGESIPTLDEALALSKDRLKLMIEVKISGYEQQFIVKLLDLLRAHDMMDQCIIGSMNRDFLQKLKAREPEIETLYIAAALYEEDYHQEYLDGYSLEVAFLTPDRVRRMHKEGKSVYAWTTNTERKIRRAIRCAPDGIITDAPYLVQYFLEYGDRNLLLEFWSDWLYPQKES